MAVHSQAVEAAQAVPLPTERLARVVVVAAPLVMEDSVVAVVVEMTLSDSVVSAAATVAPSAAVFLTHSLEKASAVAYSITWSVVAEA